MELTETLALVFTDQFIASLIFPINRSYVFDTIALMQRELIVLSFIAAICGSFLGSIVNYYFGRLISRAFIKVKVGKVANPKYRRFYYFLILTPFNLAGSLVTFLAGFGHMRFRLFILASFVTNFVYFLYHSF